MSDIKTNLNKAVGQSFELIFPTIPIRTNVRDADSFTLNIYGTVVPSVTLATTEMPWQGGVAVMAMPPVTFEPWFVNFAVDSNFDNWLIMYEWITFISNNKDRYDRTPRNYWVDASLKLNDNRGGGVLYIDFKNLFPTLLNEVAMSYREGSVNLESGITFNYTRYEVRKIQSINT